MSKSEVGLESSIQQETAPRDHFIPLVSFTLVVIVACAVYISYRIPSNPLTNTLVWLALLSAGLTGLVAFVLRRQVQVDHTIPLTYLAQSLENIAKGDDNTPVWGQERTDAVGEAARAAEKARRHWVNIPDIMIDGPDGAVPMRFNGETAPLFTRLREEIQGAVGSISKAANQLQAGAEINQAGVRGFAEQLHLTLQQLTHVTQEGSTRLAALHSDIADSTTQLRLTQENAVGQFTRMLPQFEERAEGLNEIVRLTGQQTATTLQQLQQSSHMIREAANYNQSVGQKFAHEADDLSQRLFAAVNLMRSSGKVLAETNEVARTRMHEILGTMTNAEQALTHTLDSTRSRITLTADMADMIADLSVRTESNASMMATAVDGLLQHNANLTQQVDVSGKRLDGMLQNVDAIQQKFASTVATVATRSEQIEHVLRHLHSQHERLMAELARSSGESANSLGRLALESEQLIARIEAQLALAGAIADTELRRLGDATAAAAESAQAASNQLTQATQLLLAGGSKVDTMAGSMAGQLARLDREIGASLESVVARTDQLATRNEEQLDAVYGKVEEMGQRLAALSHLTHTMGQVAAQLGQLIPQIGAGAPQEDVIQLRHDMRAVVEDLLDWQKNINATLNNIPAQMQRELGGSFDQHLILLRGQIEATRQDMMSAVSDQQQGFGRKLDSLEEVSSFVADNVTAPKADAGQLAAALRGIVTALSQINNQLHSFDQRLPAEVTPETAAEIDPEQQKMDQALTAVTDIFSSLRDRGDDVISRLNEMAVHLQSAADKIQRDA